ncbi:NmrA family NAD(P)-binding protein [Actinotalea sp. Marseille-Q4924]|uniref:NmrA family NAD(P)-binding protein n=1 Tax=Actinotalea sp. Marseille-Q4924 TaxID=2866571 RepID=UPI001CE45E9B|nr:NmrA family NAD(P)-binding protein [Actinotalea sp. Marseille-Q4924]
MEPPVLVLGATGTVGSAVLAELRALGVPARAAVRRSGQAVAGAAEAVAFDLTEPATWPGAFAGVRTMFLLRPPAVSDVRRDLLPAVAAAREAGVGHVVLLSLQGADRIPVVPHAAVEAWLRRSGMTWTFVRPSFFCQNLLTTHLADVRDRRVLPVPAGGGRTAFVDALDVAAVSARALAEPAAHRDRAWTVTGPEALTYEEVAAVLTGELGVEVRYTRPGVPGWVRHARRTLGLPWPMTVVTAGIYTTARLGLAAGTTDDVRTVLGRDPVDVASFVRRERRAWAPVGPGGAPPDHPAPTTHGGHA